MESKWQPYREPLQTTLFRTGSIAVSVGAVIAFWRGRLADWPVATLVVLWFSFGGHWVELMFLNGLRPRLPVNRAVQIPARIVVWFVGGVALGLGMALTATALAVLPPARWPVWWLGGLAFIGVELIVHLAMLVRGLPNFYNGRG